MNFTRTLAAIHAGLFGAATIIIAMVVEAILASLAHAAPP